MRKLENSELQRKSVDDFKEAQKTPIVIVLDDIRSLHNIGSVFRTADAFLIEKIYLCGITATPPNKEIHKTALGATETVAWEHAADVLSVIENLKSREFQVYAVEQVENATFLQDFEVNPKSKCPCIWQRSIWSKSASHRGLPRNHRDPAAGQQTFAQHFCKCRNCSLGLVLEDEILGRDFLLDLL
jgi:tRNA G18 (ribose-2'-O)-methylase SpoU